MEYNPDVFREQFPIVKRFVYHLIYYRTLHTAYKENELKSEFWVHTIDAHLLQAIMNWSMIFGSDGHNPTHWKRLSSTQSDELEQSFREGLPNHIGISWEEWAGYWKEITDFRSQYIAHRELYFNNPVPHLDIALNVAYYYDNWIRQVISPDLFPEPSLKESAKTLNTTVVQLVDKLIKFTKESQQDAE